MTRVLVVTDNERVQNVFEDLQESGVLTLCTVSNLMQSDKQIATFCPEFTFVQSRISGLSGEIILRHLKKLLPPEGKTVLLALDARDAAQGRKQGARIVELSGGREGLAQEITTVLQGEPNQLRKRKATGQAAATRKTRAAKKDAAAEVEGTIGDSAPLAGEEFVEQPPLAMECLPEEAPEPEADPAPHSPETANDTAAAEGTGFTPGAATFAEMMHLAETTAVTGAGVVEDRLAVGVLNHGTPLSEPIEAQDMKQGGQPESTGWSGGGGRGPEHRSKRHPLWTFPLVVAAILLPLLYLLPSEKKGAQRPEPTPQGPAPQAARVPAPTPPQTAAPVPPQAPAPVPQSRAAQVAPAKPAAAIPAAKPTPANQAGQGPAEPGLRELPQFLRGVTLDPVYAKAHPGWQRYIGARAEYKLYQEGGVYRALQVIALTGQTVPDEIVKKALQEFGGIDSYQVQSTERKQQFLIDHGRARGNLAVTVYRRINDRRVKGLVLYYMK